MKQSNLLNAQFARRLFRTVFSSWQLLAVMLIVCMNVAVGFELYAQSNTITVKGKVMADGEPVIGATVLVKGVSTGTATDMDGNFTLNVASKAVLVVSSIGYETQEVPVNGRTLINERCGSSGLRRTEESESDRSCFFSFNGRIGRKTYCQRSGGYAGNYSRFGYPAGNFYTG